MGCATSLKTNRGFEVSERYRISTEEVEQWGTGTRNNHAFDYLADILNGDYSPETARQDCLSIVNIKEHDKEREDLK